MHLLRHPLLALTVFAMLATGCSDSAEVDSTGSGVVVDSTDDVEATTTTVEAADEVEATTTESSQPATVPEDDEDLIPGDPFDIGPPTGSTLDVVGVRYDDVLNFRTLPDPSASIVDTVAPQSPTPAIVSGGEGRLLANSAWWKVTVGGVDAWANVSFLGMLGATDDVLAELTSSLAASEAPTIEAIIDDVASTREQGPVPRVEMVTPIQGLDADGAEVIIDILDVGDDALKGERMLLTFDLTFDDPDAADREVVAYTLVGALRTLICGRGLSDGACV